MTTFLLIRFIRLIRFIHSRRPGPPPWDAWDGYLELMHVRTRVRVRARVQKRRPKRPKRPAHWSCSAWTGRLGRVKSTYARGRNLSLLQGVSTGESESEMGVPSVPPPLPRLGGVPLPPAGAPPNTLRRYVLSIILPAAAGHFGRVAGSHARAPARGRVRARVGKRRPKRPAGGPGGHCGRRPLKHFQAIQTPVFTGYEPVISAPAADWPEDAASVAHFSIFQHFKRPVLAGSEPAISAPAAGREVA